MKENGFDFIDAILLLRRTWTIPRIIKNNQHQHKNPCNRRPNIETREVRIDFSFRRSFFHHCWCFSGWTSDDDSIDFLVGLQNIILHGKCLDT